jgi:hypothetical protein
MLVVSSTVYEEYRAGEPAMAQKRLPMVETAALLEGDPAMLKVAKVLVEPAGPLPRKAGADAFHIASASVYGCDFLLTWNFKHIANAMMNVE